MIDSKRLLNGTDCDFGWKLVGCEEDSGCKLVGWEEDGVCAAEDSCGVETTAMFEDRGGQSVTQQELLAVNREVKEY